MACNSCRKPFSLLRKEKGCPGCGFSYCSKCLDNKIFLPKLNAETKVCAKCKQFVSKPNEHKVEAPDAYYRRIGTMEEKQVDNTKTNSNTDSIDQQILDRLQKLKEGRATPVTITEEEIKKRLHNIKGETPTSVAELHSRLAKLKGVPTEVITSKAVLPPPDTRTEQEQANDLIKQYLEQTNIDTKYNNEFDGLLNDIESRMLKLKETGPTPQGSSKEQEHAESVDEEENIEKILEKIKAETTIEEGGISPSTNDELPFCEICNEDARLRCMGCRYLFCRTCFLEHKDDDDGCNRFEPYEAPKKSLMQ